MAVRKFKVKDSKLSCEDHILSAIGALQNLEYGKAHGELSAATVRAQELVDRRASEDEAARLLQYAYLSVTCEREEFDYTQGHVTRWLLVKAERGVEVTARDVQNFTNKHPVRYGHDNPTCDREDAPDTYRVSFRHSINRI